MNAITVCIAYSQYLRQCAENRDHFQNWVISTVPDDEETKQFAESIGAITVVPKQLRPEGVGFHAGHNKSLWINAGLDELRKRLGKVKNPDKRWVVVVDADTLLPVDFSERIAHLLPKLDRRKLYGLTGRRVAETTQEFLALKALGGWEKYLDKASTVIGYFNLFHLDGVRAAYPPSDPKRVEHDDGRFYRRFGPRRSAFLPLSALHLGGISMNWSGRREEVQPADWAASSEEPWKLAIARGGKNECALVIGFPSIGKLADLARSFRKVALLDPVQNSSGSNEDPLFDANLAFTRLRITEAMAKLPNVEWLGDAKGALREPSVIVIESEPTYDLLIEVLSKWVPRLQGKGWVCGSHYGYPFFPRTTPAIELLLGTPDEFTQRGTWALRWVRKKVQTKKYPLGVALWVFRPSDAGAALVALHALSRSWRGPIVVVEWQGETPSLRIACAQRGYEHLSFENAARERGEEVFFHPVTGLLRNVSPEIAFVAAWNFSPFDQTVWVEPGGNLPDFESLCRTANDVVFASSTSGAIFVKRTLGSFQRWWRKTFSMPLSSNGQLPAARKKALLRLGARRHLEAPSQPLLSAKNEQRLLLANKISVHFPSDASVVTCVESPDDWEALNRNWSVIDWPEGLRRLIMIGDFEPSLSPLLGQCDFITESEARTSQNCREPIWISGILAAARKYVTQRILYLDPCLSPRPGTQVFRWAAESLLASSGWAFTEFGEQVLKVAKLGPPATLVDRRWIASAFQRFVRQSAVRSFEVFANRDLSERRMLPHVEDVMLSGWHQ